MDAEELAAIKQRWSVDPMSRVGWTGWDGTGKFIAVADPRADIAALAELTQDLAEALRWALNGYAKASLWPANLGRFELQNAAYSDEDRAEFQRRKVLADAVLGPEQQQESH